MDAIIKQITNSFIEQMTMGEEIHFERGLMELFFTLRDMNKSFAEVFTKKVYDIKVSAQSGVLKKFKSVENQFILASDFFDIMSNEL